MFRESGMTAHAVFAEGVDSREIDDNPLKLPNAKNVAPGELSAITVVSRAKI
jgi:hypothetical protein